MADAPKPLTPLHEAFALLVALLAKAPLPEGIREELQPLLDRIKRLLDPEG